MANLACSDAGPNRKIYTIGFTKKTAAQFFGLIRTAGITRLLDVRLNNVSQLAGFTKRDDLAFFAREICGVDYLHMPLLAPTQAMLDSLKKHKGAWADYESAFLELMVQREIERKLDNRLFSARTVMLCSEPTADHCHRRLVAEYLEEKWGGFEIHHL